MILYAHTFIVRGAGAFPIDMLRYDSCKPAHEPDSQTIVNSFYRDDNLGNSWTLSLTTTNTRKGWTPTIGRWKSMGWTVDLTSLDRREVQA